MIKSKSKNASAAVPTQNSIISIIKNRLVEMNDIIDIVVKNSASRVSAYSKNTITELALYGEIVKTVFSSNGVIILMLEASDKLNNFGKKTIKTEVIKKSLTNLLSVYNYCIESLKQLSSTAQGMNLNSDVIKNIKELLSTIEKITNINVETSFVKLHLKFYKIRRNIKALVKSLDKISKIKIDISVVKELKIRLTPLKDALTEIKSILEYVNEIKRIKFIGVKMKLIGKCLRIIANNIVESVIKMIKFAPILMFSELVLVSIKKIVTSISDIFVLVNGLKLNLKTLIKLKLVNPFLSMLIPVLRRINLISRVITQNSSIIDTTKIYTVFLLVKDLFDMIRDMRVGILMKIKIRNLSICIRSLRIVIRSLNRLRVRARTVLNIILLKIVIQNLVKLFLIITLASPIFVIGSLAIWVVVAAILVLNFAIRLIARILIKLVNPKIIIGLLAMILITTMITIISVMFLAIALVAKPVVKASLWILALFGVILASMLIMVLIGAVAVSAIYIVGIAIAGLLIMMTMIGLIFLMALMLKLLTTIDLDREEIRLAVQNVIDTAFLVISAIFDREDNKDPKKSNKGKFAKLIKSVSSTIFAIWEMALAIPFLALTIVAISFVLLIAAQLRLLQILDLDSSTISENVKIVINTSLMVIDTIFNRPDADGKESKKSWIVSVIENFGGTIFTIVKAVMAVAFLAIVLVAILLVLLIAAQLRLLQALDLDTAKIEENVAITINASLMVINTIFNRPDTDGKESNKPWIISVIENFAGTLVNIIKAVMAVAFLAIVLVAILLVLLIAAQLRLLQTLNLDPSKIGRNVGITITAAMLVVDNIFNRPDANSKESNKSWIISVIENFAGTLVNIIKAIMAIAFLAVVLVAILLLDLIATELLILQKINLDPSKIRMNVGLVIDTAFLVVDALFNRPDEDNSESNKPWIVSVIESFAENLICIIKAIMAIAFLSVAIVAILLINVIAAELLLLQKINLDSNIIQTNVNLVIDTALQVVDTLFNKKDKDTDSSNKSWIVSLLEYIGGPIVKIAQAIMAIAFLATAIAMVALITVLANQLKTIAEINLPKDITPKVNQILIAADQVVNAINNRKDTLGTSPNEKKKGFLRRFFDKLSSAIDMIASMAWVSSAIIAVGMVAQLAEHLKTIHDIPDVGDIITKVNVICGTADTLIKKMTSKPDVEISTNNNNRLALIDQINTSIKGVGNITSSQMNTINKAFDNYGKFVDKINSIDVKKLETSTKMFEQMSKFSTSIRGDFNKLAEALNENLMPVLEELKEIMEKIPEKLDTGFQNTSASIAATNAPTTRENVEAQISRENPNMTPDQVGKIVDKRLAEKSKSDSTGVAAKLDELINLLKGYGSENVVVQTV